MSAFEIITKEEYEDSVAVSDPGMYHGEPPGGEGTATEYPLTWCDFCKGYYIEEFHHGRRDDAGRDSNEA